MAKFVVMGAALKCSFGSAPSTLIVQDLSRSKIGGKLMATINDSKVFNIAPFAMCSSTMNPQVQAATAAAGGVFTPMPCMPAVSLPWSPGGDVLISGVPALMENGKCLCQWGGQISITKPGNTTTEG